MKEKGGERIRNTSAMSLIIMKENSYEKVMREFI